MAITFIPRDKSNIQRQQLLQTGLASFNQSVLAAEQLEESKLSGVSNRAQQEALTEQASATAAATRMKNKVLKSLPPKVQQEIYTGALTAQKNQLFNQKAQIDMLTQGARNQAQLNALELGNQAKQFQVEKARFAAPYQEALAVAEAEIIKSTNQSARLKAEADARQSRLTERTEALKSVSGDAGKSAIFQAFEQNKTAAEMVEIGVAAEQSAAAALKSSESGQRIAEQRRVEETKKSPAKQKREAKQFGTSTFERRQSAITNVQATQPTIKIKFDKTPHPLAIGGKGDFEIDYPEAVELGKQDEWLKGYEETFGEPYDIPNGQQTDLEKADGPVVIKNQVEYDALAAGTQYVDANGNPGTKK